jgi:N-dimethylarginine dimethylaminohydrolase
MESVTVERQAGSVEREAPASPYEAYLAERRARDWRLADLPFADRGIDPSGWAYEGLDYLDTLPEVWGRKCGENGIGLLRRVALSKITDAELRVYDQRYPYQEDRTWLDSHGLLKADIPKMQEEQAAYAELLEQQGIEVHWIDWGESPMSAFGPMQAMWAASDLVVWRGGSVIQKTGWHPFSFGRSEWMARWLQHEVGVPILYTVQGKGVQEPATTIWLADDIWVTALSAAYNAEGNRQLEAVVRRTSGVEDLEVHVMHLSTDRFFDRRSGLSAHITNVICPLDIDKVLLYPGGVDAGTHRWLRSKGYKIAEIDREEQITFTPANTIPLQPGVIFMVAEAKRAIATVRRLGVEVIEVPNEEFMKIGGALHCRTLRIQRDPGPHKNS